jgi:8-amino-7-oxononanoate synthase
VDGRRVLAFCSNDYLGLAADPRVRAAFVHGVETYGTGSGAALAAFTGRPRALLFSTGYMANVGVIGALVGRGDTVFEDRLNHASLIDGGLLSGARFRRYPHVDAVSLAAQLAGGRGEKLVTTDSVFSMDGDLAPLPGLAEVCREHGAWLMVDDAHGLGVLGKEGRGSLAHFGLGLADVPVLVGTLGKAFGTSGAFVAGSEALIETLIQSARSYIYTTATPPAVAEATRESLRIGAAEEWRRDKLAVLVHRFREGAAQLGLPLTASQTPIQPVVAGDAGRALAWSRALALQGIVVTAIRPPTVPEGSARLRVTFSALHEEKHVDRLLDALAALPPGEAA